jgi:SWI/SNF-related matrix-associated actin-dependent regulator 1 of chromatin subfamily A
MRGLPPRGSPDSSQTLPPAPVVLEDVIVIADDDEEYSEPEESPTPEDPEEAGLLKLLNEVEMKDLAALTGDKEGDLNILIANRPFTSITQVRAVSRVANGKGKRQKAEIGEAVIDKVRLFMKAIKAVDEIVIESEKRAGRIKDQIKAWGVDPLGLRAPDCLGATSPGLSKPAKNTRHTSFKPLQPKSMNPDLPMHDFQIFGVNWMNLLFQRGYGGILADDMGLGKTCQVIGLMCRMLEDWEEGQLPTKPFPNLVVVPPSTLDNWLAEFDKFAPDLGVVKYSGSQSERMQIAGDLIEDSDSCHVILTSYSQFSSLEDLQNLNQIGLHSAIFDEGQILKNPSTLQYNRLRKLRVHWRMLLSGTPIQNHLMEMIALLSFVDPELFRDSMEDIQYVFDHKIHSKNLSNTALLYGERVNRARSILEPFILQRLKDQVGQNLPVKTQTIIHCDLPPAQKTLYDKYEAMFRTEPGDRPKTTRVAVAARDNDQNNVWIQLKKAALHPQLFRLHFTDEKVEKMASILFKNVPSRDLDLAEPKIHLLLNDLKSRSDFDLHLYCQDFPALLGKYDIEYGSWRASGKVKKLLELIEAYQRNGDRVLVFSKFTKMIDILSYTLDREEIRHCVLTGGSAVGERQQEIDRFQRDPDIPVFLLTTGAGGTGINLTAANKVIIFDMSSNPQDDKQAENRAHRIGQQRPVEVIHLISTGTVEELIYLTCQKKIELANKVTNIESNSESSESKVKAAVKELMERGYGKDTQ